MSAKKKENEDSVVTFKQAPGQSKDDAWLIYETKVTGAANNLHPEHGIHLSFLSNSMTSCQIGA